MDQPIHSPYAIFNRLSDKSILALAAWQAAYNRSQGK